MSYLPYLFSLFTLLAALPAQGLTSPADCERALIHHVRSAPLFTKWSHLPGDLDGRAHSTLLLKLRPGQLTIALPTGSRLRAFPTVNVDHAGRVYAVLHGYNDDFERERVAVAALNGGSRLRYQRLDRDGDEPPAPTLNHELARRVPGLAQMTRVALLVDRWFDQFSGYVNLKRIAADQTTDVRARLARRLHWRMNPPAYVAPVTAREVRAFVNPGRVGAVLDREGWLSGRLYPFFGDRVPKISITEPGSLAKITFELVDTLNPERQVETRDAIQRGDLRTWSFTDLTRDQRLKRLESAWRLIDRGVWGSDRPESLIWFEIERTIAEYRRLTATQWTPAPPVLPVAHIARRSQELFSPAYARLRDRRLMFILDGPGDQKWVLIRGLDVAHSDTSILRDEIELETGRVISDKVEMHLKAARADKDVRPEISWRDLLLTTRRTEMFVTQSVVTITPPTGLLVNHVLIPLAQLPLYRVDVRTGLAGRWIEDVVGPYLYRVHRRAPLLEDGRRSVVGILPDGRSYLATYSVEWQMNARPIVWITGFEIINRTRAWAFWQRASREAGESALLVNLKEALSPEETLSGVTPMPDGQRIRVVHDQPVTGLGITVNPRWTPQTADRRPITGNFRSDGLVYEGRQIRSLRFLGHLVFENYVRTGLDAPRVIAVMLRSAKAVVDPSTKCASVGSRGRTYEICFATIESGWASVKSIRPLN